MTFPRMSLFLVLAACASSAPPTAAPASPAAPAPRGPYLGEIATDRPTIFGRGVVSRRYYELNAAFSPAGDELFFTLADAGGGRAGYTLLRTVRAADGTWS